MAIVGCPLSRPTTEKRKTKNEKRKNANILFFTTILTVDERKKHKI
jgi:hypothetical protein